MKTFHLSALLLGFGERSEAREPDLIRGFPDHRGQLVFRGLAGQFLQSL